MKKIINQDSLIIIGLIMIVIVVAAISSYAYITWKGRDDTATLTTTIGNLATITFNDGVEINSNNLTPVLNYEDGIVSTFSITKKIDNSVYINSFLTINKIDQELISDSLKFVLLKSDDNSRFSIISTGSFNTIENNKLTILDDLEINTKTTYYKLYIYIDGTQNNTNMSNKNLEMTLNIGAIEKETQENTLNVTSSTSMTNNTEKE